MSRLSGLWYMARKPPSGTLTQNGEPGPTPQVRGNALADPTIAEGRITSSTGLVSRWELDQAGLRFYNNVNSALMNLNADTGSATFSGTITAGTISGATITGGSISGTTLSGSTVSGNTISGGSITSTTIDSTTITGGTIRTAASGQRVEMDSSQFDRIRFYDSGNTIRGILYSSGTDFLCYGTNRVFLYSASGPVVVQAVSGAVELHGSGSTGVVVETVTGFTIRANAWPNSPANPSSGCKLYVENNGGVVTLWARFANGVSRSLATN